MTVPITLPSATGDFPDQLLPQGRNGAAPFGGVENMIANRLQYKQHQGRPLLHWWGGWDAGAITFATSGATVFRFARHDALEGGGRRLRMDVHSLPPKNAADSTTAGVVLSGYNNPVGANGTGAYYPNQILVAGGLTDNDDDEVTAAVDEITIGFDNVRPVAGCVYEDQIKALNVSDTVGGDQFKAGAEVIATLSGSYYTMDRLRDRLNHVHQNRTTQISWACRDDEYVEFATSSQAYRYIFDQTIGTGGTAPSATGPADTLPNLYAGYGISTLVRVYVYVYAAMSGNTDTGTLAVANKASGAMGAMTALTNPVSIGGTGYAWYPSLGSLTASTGAYFLSPTTAAFDRICLGARSGGATDKVRIKAWTMIVYPVSD
jgi:hypothetical protein